MEKVIPTGVQADGTQYYEISGLPGAPKEIPGILPRRTGDWEISGNSARLIPLRTPNVGEGISVNTNAGSLRIRLTIIRKTGVMVGQVEVLNTPKGTEQHIYGIKQGDMVTVRGMPFVALVHNN